MLIRQVALQFLVIVLQVGHFSAQFLQALGDRPLHLTGALGEASGARHGLIKGNSSVVGGGKVHRRASRMGEREGVRADGTIRRSRYWEMSREAWAALDAN